MYNLGVDTTRALSLVISDGGEMAERPWYSEGNRDRDPETWQIVPVGNGLVACFITFSWQNYIPPLYFV